MKWSKLLSSNWLHGVELVLNLLQFLLRRVHCIAGVVQLCQTEQH